jgi:hypothetical protein
MQGRQDSGKEPREWFVSPEPASVNGRGKHHTIPQRPPGMIRVDQPPPARRVARPQHQAPTAKNRRRRLFWLGAIFIICGLLACAIGYAAVNLINAANTASGGAAAAADFLAALSSRSYDEAYSDLGAAITVEITPEEFKQQAITNDTCYGPITNYTQVPGSASVDDSTHTQSYTYSITRQKLKQPYQLRLTLQEDTTTENWAVTSYSNDLGPGLSQCT